MDNTAGLEDWAILAAVVGASTAVGYLAYYLALSYMSQPAYDSSSETSSAHYGSPCIRPVFDNYHPQLLWAPPRNQSR